MQLATVHKLFVYAEWTKNTLTVLSLSQAAVMNISLIGVLHKTIECAHADGFVPYMQIAERESEIAPIVLVLGTQPPPPIN
jgi:hypothetical protein